LESTRCYEGHTNYISIRQAEVFYAGLGIYDTMQLIKPECSYYMHRNWPASMGCCSSCAGEKGKRSGLTNESPVIDGIDLTAKLHPSGYRAAGHDVPFRISTCWSASPICCAARDTRAGFWGDGLIMLSSPAWRLSSSQNLMARPRLRRLEKGRTREGEVVREARFEWPPRIFGALGRARDWGALAKVKLKPKAAAHLAGQNNRAVGWRRKPQPRNPKPSGWVWR